MYSIDLLERFQGEGILITWMHWCCSLYSRKKVFKITKDLDVEGGSETFSIAEPENMSAGNR